MEVDSHCKSQVHSALAYDWGHQAEMGADIQQRLEYIEQLRQFAAPFPLAHRLRAQGLLSGFVVVAMRWVIERSNADGADGTLQGVGQEF